MAAPIRRVREHLLSSELLGEGGRLLVAVSGGLDSMVLLHALRFHCGSRWQLTAAHLDHAMRTDSRAVADWLHGVCTAWDVPLVMERCAVAPAGEAAARRVRYRFLATVAAASACDRILTAHHADDQAETVLLRLARGTGLDGLAGIPPRRGPVVRPVLELTRALFTAYAGAARLSWRDDPTNLDIRYGRNRVRSVVLPALEAVHPRAAAHISALASLARRERAAWRAVVETVLRDTVISEGSAPPFLLARERLLSYHPVVRARALRALARRCGASLDRAGTGRSVEFISRGVSGASIELHGGITLSREFDTIRLERPAGPIVPTALRIASTDAGQARWGSGTAGRTVKWAPGPPPADAPLAAAFDPSLLRFPLEIRTWQHGDRIRLACGTKKVKKLFQEHRIGGSARVRWPVLADGTGRILWVPGVAQAADVARAGVGGVFHIMVADGDSF